MLSHYYLFSPPKELCDLRTQRQARAHLEWFTTSIPGRLQQLQDVVRLTRPDLTLDASPSSLVPLGAWFNGQVEERPSRTDDFGIGTLPEWAVPSSTLTDRSLSLAIDVGIYLADVLRTQHPHLEWDYVRKPKNDLDYHRPVLKPFEGWLHCNPLRLSTNVALKAVQEHNADAELPLLYDYWSRFIAPPYAG